MKTILPFLLLVLIHHFLLAPLIRRKLPLYIGLLLALLVLFGAWCLSPASQPVGPPPPEWQSGMAPPPPPERDGNRPEPRGGRGPIRPEVMRIIIGVLLIGVDLGVYFYVESRRKERRMKELQAENLKMKAENQEMKSALFTQEADPILHFKADYRTISIDVRKIVNVESMSEYVKIFLSDTEEPVIVLYSLKRLMEQLPKGRFLRIHRSHIISVDHIAEASRSSVRLDNGITLPVGESYRPAFAEYLASRKVD